jgi:hypothetical protein
MKKIILLTTLISFFIACIALAMGTDTHDKHGAKDAMEGMQHGSETHDGTFKHETMAGDVHAEFQIMELASMNMKDPDGKTHHVMASFMRDGKKIEKIAGKVKLISPSGKEQMASLKDFGSGVFAANFSIDQPGKWGVICLFKDQEAQQTVKFWYTHMKM